MNDSTLPASATKARTKRGLSTQVLLLALVVATALPPVLFSLFQVRSADKKARENAEETALQLARRIATRVDDHVSVVDALLVTLTRVVTIDSNRANLNHALLASVSKDLGSRFLSLSVADRTGHVIGLSTSAQPLGPLTMADRKYFREAMASHGIGVGEPVVGRVFGQRSLSIGRAVLGVSGEPIGVVSASTRLEQLRPLLIPVNLPAEAVVTLVNDDGVVLARTEDAEHWVGRSVRSLPSLRPVFEINEGVREIKGEDGKIRLSGFATASRVPWRVLVGIPRDDALQAVWLLENEALALGAISLLVSLGLAWLIARRIADPIVALTADVNAYAAGDLSHRTTVQAGGEPGQLAVTFNRMAATLERRRDELAETEQRYRILFDTLPLPMWVYDHATLRFLQVNQAAVDRYGWTREEFLDMTVAEIRPPDEAVRLGNVIRQRKRERVVGMPWRHRTRAGEIIDVEVTSDDLLDGTARARLVAVVDVTDRNRTDAALRASQEQLRQSQKMEAVGSLAGGIAHDFNNLLTAILGYCDLALESVPFDSPVGEDVQEIRRAAKRASELTHQLLAFSRRQVLNPRVFALNTAVEETEKILRRLISESIMLEMVLMEESPSVRADPAQVEQVLMNLAVNARDAMPHGGRLVLATGESLFTRSQAVAGGTIPPGRYATLSVMDSGTGITPEVREHLFEPFFTTKERGHGTGLGLATVYGIAQQSGGGVDLQSIPGEGSTFTVYFPLASRRELAISAQRTTAETAKGEGTILLAEDDDAVRAIVRTTLERAGYRVLSASDGANALALLEGHTGQIDLLLTDVIMPGMNGRELAEKMTQRRPGLPVLFVSGYTGNVLADLGLKTADTALLDKPFTPAALTAAVAALISKSTE
ncbi:MAG: putative two-component hybrid sensor and regulator [Gemmatimonadetes bacterium]|nr:putative two-component hybrid sensor and regulator [Gemmatimonadota bacterium]